MVVPDNAWGRVNNVSTGFFFLTTTLILLMCGFLYFVFPLARERSDLVLYSLSCLLLLIIVFGVGVVSSKVVFRPGYLEHKFFGIVRKRIAISDLEKVNRHITMRGTPFYDFFVVGSPMPYRLVDFYELHDSLTGWLQRHGKDLG